MSRFSPTVRPRSGREGQPRAADRIIQALDQLRRHQLTEEELDLRKERQKAELFERGFSEEAPTEDVRLPESDEDVLTRDIDLGGVPGGARTRRARELESVLFPGAGPTPRMETDRGPGGQAGVSVPSPGSGGGPLIEELEQLKRRGPTLPEDAHGGPRESRGRGDTGAGLGRGGPLLDELTGLNRQDPTGSREGKAAPRRGRTPPDTGALGADEFMIRALDQVRQQGPDPRGEGPAPGEEQDPDVRHPPGAFVPEAMDFTTEAIFEGPQVDTRMGLQRPAPERTVERVPDRVERVGDGLFFDPDRTPTARESARKMRVIQGLESLRNLDPEERAILEAEASGISPRAVDLAFDDRRDFTAAELRAAGVPEERIPAALSDPILARQLVRNAGDEDYTAEQLRDAGVPEERIPLALQDPILARQLLRDAGETAEADLGFQDRLEDLLRSGVARERAEAIARDETAYRQFVENQRGPSSRRSESIPSFSQAMDIVRDFYARRNREGFVTGYALNNREMFDLADQMARGVLDTSELPEVSREPVDAGSDSLRDLLDEEEEEREKVPGAKGFFQRVFPGGESGFVEPDSTPQASDESGRDELDRARQLVQNYPEIPDEEMREILSEEGFTDGEIDRILGGR